MAAKVTLDSLSLITLSIRLFTIRALYGFVIKSTAPRPKHFNSSSCELFPVVTITGTLASKESDFWRVKNSNLSHTGITTSNKIMDISL